MQSDSFAFAREEIQIILRGDACRFFRPSSFAYLFLRTSIYRGFGLLDERSELRLQIIPPRGHHS